MCLGGTKQVAPPPSPTVTTADDATVKAARDRRIRLGQQTGGQLATRLFLSKGQSSGSSIRLGG